MNERGFEKALERGFADLRARRGPCPAAEKLAALAAGEIPPEEMSSLRAHVAVCGVCDAVLVRLQKFEEAKDSDSPSEAREERMPAKLLPARRGISAGVAVAGYALAAGVLICAYLGILPKRPAEQAELMWDAAENIDLNRVRGGAAPAAAKASSRFVVLSFFVDVRPDLHYEAVLDAGEAKSVTSYDGVGNFRLVVDRRLLGPGRHVLTVREGNLRTVEFPFELK